MTPDPVAIVRGALGKPMLSKEDCLAVWVAVLEGVRKPSKAAALIGLQELPFGPSSPDHASRAFTAMIDALLAEGR